MKRRLFALGFGLMVHSLFLVAVTLMAYSLYTGLQSGFGPFTGATAIFVNMLLVIQFPLLHSFFLGDRGRKLLKRMMPMKMGAPLATTTYAGIASLQLIIFFAGWSPMNSVLWVPPATIKAELTAIYAGSWLLLLVAMRETGLGLQTGSLGWWSIWKNRAPEYPPLPVDRPLHSIVRHPIYVAFALILWTSPVFTIEKVVLATAWSIYCVAGSRIKERRLLRFHGANYGDYMKRVPFWIPCRRHVPDAATNQPDADVIVVGGGPVGLLLANLLGQAGRRVILVESSNGEPCRSMAIGITPPSLELLASLGLDESFIARGVCIREARVHENHREVGRLNLTAARDAYPFILSLPQSDTVQLLRHHLERFPGVRVLRGCRAVAMDQDDDGVNLHIVEPGAPASRVVRASLLAACDGARSESADWLGIAKKVSFYDPVFTMGDFHDRSGLGDVAHLFFGTERPVESFPLPAGKRRWVVRCGWRQREDLHESIATAVTRLTGIALSESDQLDTSRFRPQRKMARCFYRGRVALCGDAAHVMSPIGGQGMNTGFGDAAFLARAFEAMLDDPARVGSWMRLYDRNRKRAFRVAAARAATGMGLGVARGRFASRIREVLVGILLARGVSHRAVQRWFTMRSLPDFRKQLIRAARLVERKYTAA